MITTYWAPRFFDGESILHNVLFCLDDQKVVTLEAGKALTSIKLPPSDVQILEGIVSPAFIDLQINGGGGVLFNNTPTPEGLNKISLAHQQYGTYYYLPTVITDDVAIMEQAADAVANQIKGSDPQILGIHFEGPHISQPKKGVHPAQHVRGFSERERAIYQRMDLGIKKITIAPESVSPDDLAFLRQNHWHVAIGHTNSTAKQIKPLLDQGASGFTHLFNAMSQITGREPGAVGVALSRKDAFAGIILDGHHVDYDNARLAWTIKNENKKTHDQRLFLVSDAMATVGSNDARFNLFGIDIKVFEGKLTTEDGTLAGAHLTLLESVKNAVLELDININDALKMATTIPANFIHSELALPVRIGDQRQLIHLDDKRWQATLLS